MNIILLICLFIDSTLGAYSRHLQKNALPTVSSSQNNAASNEGESKGEDAKEPHQPRLPSLIQRTAIRRSSHGCNEETLDTPPPLNPFSPFTLPQATASVSRSAPHLHPKSSNLKAITFGSITRIDDPTEYYDIYCQPIGNGRYGTVFRAESLNDPNLTVAIKQLKFSRTPRETVAQEVCLLYFLKHPRIVQMYETFESFNRDTVWIVCEYLEGDTLEAYSTASRKAHRTQLPLEVVLVIGRQLLEGLGYIHAWNIIHRDLKPSNIMFSKEGVKIIDLGLASEPSSQPRDHYSPCGSALFFSPERLVKGMGYGTKSDIWALGVTLVSLFTDPYPGSERMDVEGFTQQVLAAEGLWFKKESVPEEAMEMIGPCLEWLAGERRSAEMLLELDIIANNYSDDILKEYILNHIINNGIGD